MLVWIIKAIIVNIFTLLAYILNPIVVLFCDEKGELHGILSIFATNDNKSADIEWMISEHCVPKFAEYDYDKHYIYHYEEKTESECIAGYVDLIDPNFTLKEKFQRYICRLCWLNRNPVYTLSAMFDNTFNPIILDVIKNRQEFENEFYFAYQQNQNLNGLLNIIRLIIYGKFCLWLYIRWCPWFCIRTYFGWKYKFVQPHMGKYVSSIAVYCSPFRKSS